MKDILANGALAPRAVFSQARDPDHAQYVHNVWWSQSDVVFAALFIERIKARGYGTPSLDEVIRLRDRGLD